MNPLILIVEDEGLIALDLKKKLEQSGYTVPAIDDNGPDALLSVERLRPALVLMDIRIRGSQDGIAVAAEIRRRFHIPVIFTTAHADRETLDRARITEPFGYIVKPFHGVDFRAQIEMALWKHMMEQKLHASEAWLATTFRNTADALIATDSEGSVRLMNPPSERLTGWDVAEAQGKPLLEVFQVFEEATGRPVANPLNAIHQGLDPGAIRRTFKQFRRDGSGPVIVEAVFSSNYDEGQLLGIIVVFRDITAQRMAEKNDRQMDKMNALTQLAVGLGEDLAESQRSMDVSLRRLMASAESSTLRLLGNVQECATQQQSIIQQLVELGNTNAGQAVPVDLNDLLTGMVTKLRKALGPRRTLKLKLDPEIPRIEANPLELRENLMRVVAEARQAMPDGGSVEISTAKVSSTDMERGVQIAIRDTGKGILGAPTERLFDPYSQARRGNHKAGLSLALLHRFVALSGGQIEVESIGGVGAAYLLSFPAVDDLISASHAGNLDHPRLGAPLVSQIGGTLEG